MKKVLILSLGRTGSLPYYGETISSYFKNLDYTILVSKNRSINKPVENSVSINTYTNKFNFITNTLIYLPFLFVKYFIKIFKEYDVLYLPYKHFWDIPFIIIFKILGKKVLFTVHDGELHKGEKNLITQGLNNFRMKSASELVFLTNYVKDLVSNKFNINKVSHIIPHPIIENKYVDLNEQKKPSNNVLFLGRIDKYKGVELLMDSVLEIEEHFDELVIAGKSLYDIKYISHPKITVNDKYLTNREIGELLTWADLLVLPYTEATQSGVIALGIYAELPMLCTNVGGFKEQLEEDECLWCEPNKNSIQKGLVDFFKNRIDRKEIITKMKQKKKELSFSNTSKKIEDILINKNN